MLDGIVKYLYESLFVHNRVLFSIARTSNHSLKDWFVLADTGAKMISVYHVLVRSILILIYFSVGIFSVCLKLD